MYWKLPSLSSGLYHTNIRTIEINFTMNQKFSNPKIFKLWHDQLEHPGSIMMCLIIKNSHGYQLKNQKILLPTQSPCAACSQGKLIIQSSPMKVSLESPKFLERIQGDICGPIYPSCGPFRYFLVLIDASTRWSHVSLLYSCGVVFTKFLAQIIRLRAQFPDFPIKKIILDNASEFTCKPFNDYCMSIGIDVEYFVAHTHTQNSSVVLTPEDVKPVGYKWVFVRKRNERNETVRYKVRLVAQGFSQRPGIDYEETYSPVMDAIIFQFLVSLVTSEWLEMCLMDIVTAYLYGSIDTDIYMKFSEGFKVPKANKLKPCSLFSLKVQRSLYGLKQFRRMWYNRLSNYLLKEGRVNNPICPYVFIKKSEIGFAIVAIYVDDLNLIGTPEELSKTTSYLK